MRRYRPTHLERVINEHYERHGIITVSDMNLERIAASFDIELYFHHGPSFADWDDSPGGHRIIVIDSRKPEPERRAIFFHELTHPLRHCGRQEHLHELFVELQEIQAAQFQLAAALPSFMLAQYREAAPANIGKIIAEDFCLPLTLVMRRLEQIRNRIFNDEMLRQNKRFQLPHGIDITKPHVLQVIQRLREIQRRKKGHS